MDISFIEPTQPKIFHLHIDAKHLPIELEKFAKESLRFYDSNFNGHPEGYDHFEPQKHLTLKLKHKKDFFSTWSKLEKEAAKCSDFVGYLEGEYIPFDDFIPYKPYKDLPIPFKINRRILDGSEDEEFRQTEIHLTMMKEHSHPDLIQKLLDSGLYGAYIPKKDGDFLVLTMQGFVRDIEPLYHSVKSFMEQSGGAYRCTLKEERAIKYKMQGIDSSDLPEVIDSIEYFNV
jgi:hypothetical protein